MESCIVFDIETTGFYPESHKITEIGAIKIKNGQILETYSQLINPQVPIPQEIVNLTGITSALVENMPTIEEVLPKFIDFCEDYPIMGHNILFDFSFIKTNAQQQKLRFERLGLDTLAIARILLPRLEKRSLTYLCEHYQIERAQAHRAYDDAMATYVLYTKMKDEFYNEMNEALFVPKPIHWRPQKQEPISLKQEKFLQDLIKRHDLVLVKPIKEYSKSEASKEIDTILFQYGKKLT